MNNINLYNGDCIKIMQSLIGQNIKVDAVITDPPYNISRKTNFHTLKRRKFIGIEIDKNYFEIATNRIENEG